MPQKHRYAGASALITTKLDSSRIGELSELAAKRSETLEVLISLEESTHGRFLYSARNRMTGGRIVYMKFEVSVREVSSLRSVKTRILSYKVNRTWLIVVPLPWQMTAWKNYRDFMYALAEGIKSADPEAKTAVTEIAA
jgi:hypothetical protein